MTNHPRPVARFFGWLLMGVGGLVAATTGACSAWFLVMPILGGGGFDFAGVLGWILLVFMIGGLPCLIGVGLFLGGRSLVKPRNRRRYLPSESDDAQP
jgi:hypothetical protein